MTRVVSVILTVCVAVVSVGLAAIQGRAAEAAYWPRFHGPKGDNLSTDTNLLKTWPEKGPTLLWTAKGIGEGYAGVTTSEGRIYTCGNLGDKTVLSALDGQGRIRWQMPNGPAWTGSNPGVRGTPTLDGQFVYHESPLGRVACYEAKTGKEVSARNIIEEFHGKVPTWALAESVLIDGDRLICCPGGPETAVVALDKRTGKTIWQSPTADGEGIAYATPTLAECQGLRMILTMTLKALIGVNADTGELLFRYPHETDYDVNALKPIYHDGRIFISSGYGTTGSVQLKLDVQGKKASVTKAWVSRELDNHHGGVVLLNGDLYGASDKFNGGRWVCLDWKTGEKKYAERGVGKGSLTVADGMLYTMSENRDVGLVPAVPGEHKLAGKFKLPSGGEGPTWAHPVVCGGRLYLRHGDFLYCYDVRAAE